MDDEIQKKYTLASPFMDERMKRIYLAAEALSLGHGGITRVSQATNTSRTTITQGIREIGQAQKISVIDRIRQEGGGRKRLTEKYPEIIVELEKLIDPYTRGDPESPLRWTSKSTRQLSDVMNENGFRISHVTVASILRGLGYSLQANSKTLEGSGDHPERDEQFVYINDKTKAFQQAGDPVISVDTKKKELIGDFKNNGREYQPQGQPEKVRVHDFEIKELGKANPYGIYDVTANMGWVNVGIDHDTAQFAVESIRKWYQMMGIELYPQAKNLLITADGGGSNGHRVRLWKTELQKLADELDITITVAHFPPGTSKWNKIEHRLFSYITQNWRGRPLISMEVIVSLIASTKTKNGLTVKCSVDTEQYAKGIKVSDDEMNSLNLSRSQFHGEWNYSIAPRNDHVII